MSVNIFCADWCSLREDRCYICAILVYPTGRSLRTHHCDELLFRTELSKAVIKMGHRGGVWIRARPPKCADHLQVIWYTYSTRDTCSHSDCHAEFVGFYLV